MRVELAILFLGFLSPGCLAHAESNLRDLESEQFFGFRIGMSQKDLLSAAKEKGFPKVLDLDKVAKPSMFIEPGTCLTAAGTSNGGKKKYSVLKCVGRGKIAHSVSWVTFELFNGKVYALSVGFEPKLGRQVVSDVLAKFGFPKTTEYLSGHASKCITERLQCSKQTCYEATWETSVRRLTLAYVGSSLETGSAVKLRAVDTVLVESVKRLGVLDSVEKVIANLIVVDAD